VANVVTLMDVAKRANVHLSTASRALSPDYAKYVGEATRLKVLRAAEELEYRPNALAQGLRKGRTGVVGVVVVHVEQPFTATVLRGMENSLEAVGIMPLIAETHGSSERLRRAFEHLIAWRADAIITTAVRYGDADIIERFAREVPIVLAVRSLPGGRLPTIAHDDTVGGALAARHLLELGHRRIGELCGPPDVSSFAQRQAGFRAALAEGGVTETVAQTSLVGATLDEGRRAAAALLSRDGARPTAVFAHNDLMAVGAMDVFSEAGLSCPGDISVIGYDDILFADHLVPSLTTIRLSSFHLGRMAGEMTYSLLQSPDSPPPTISLPPELIVRDSTAPPAEAPGASRPPSRARSR